MPPLVRMRTGSLYKIVRACELSTGKMIRTAALLSSTGGLFLLSPQAAVATEQLAAAPTQAAATDTVNGGEKNAHFSKPVEREMAGGANHIYVLELSAGAYMKVSIEQLGLDIAIQLTSDDLMEALVFDSVESSRGTEVIEFVAAKAGPVKLEVKAFDRKATLGRYRLHLDALHPASTDDRLRAEAARLEAEAYSLRTRDEEASLREALTKLDLSLAKRRLAGDRAGEMLALVALALVKDSLGDKPHAIEDLEASLALARELNEEIAEAGVRYLLATIQDEMGVARPALEHLQQALSIYERRDDLRGKAKTLNSLASLRDKTGEMQAAVELYEHSLSLCRQIGDRLCQALVLNNLGRVRSLLDQYAEALINYEESLSLLRDLENRKYEAWLLTNIGAVYEKSGLPDRALAQYNSALLLRKEIEDRFGQAFTLHNMAAIYAYIGEPQRALELYRDALVLWRGTGARRNEAVTLSNVGDLYSQLGERERALKIHLEVLPIKRETADRDGEAVTLNDIGWQYASLGKHEEAMIHYRASLSIFRELGSKRKQATVLNNIAQSYVSRGDYEASITYSEESIRLRREVQDERGEASSLLTLARAAIALGRLEQAGVSCERALSLARSTKDRLREGEALLALARYQRAIGSQKQALATVDQSIDALESVRSRLSGEALRATALGTIQKHYELRIDLLMGFSQEQRSTVLAKEAFKTSERKRARGLLDSLGSSVFQISRGGQNEQLEKLRVLAARVSALEFRRTKIADSNRGSQDLLKLERQLETAVEEYDETRARLLQGDREYGALVSPPDTGIAEAQNLVDQETVLLEYSLGEPRSYLWVIGRAGSEIYRLPGRAKIEALVMELSESARASAASLGRRSFEAKARKLGEVLLGPARGWIGVKRIVTVPDGSLQYLPLSLLGDPTLGRNQYEPLIARHEVVSLPSVAVLGALRRRVDAVQARIGVAAVIADPVVSLEDTRFRQRRRGGGGGLEIETPQMEGGQRETPLSRAAEDVGLKDFPSLPFSGRELEAIERFLSPSTLFQATGFAANRNLITSGKLSTFRILHFATHGLLNTRHPELSGLVLSLYDEQGREQDGFLRVHEIYNLDLPADLVVLSACRTALGKDVKGEGLIGLTRAFFYAGAAGVVSSLWKVDDHATAELMKRFYRKLLKEKLPPAAALREAQLSMWRDPAWQAPYYWAGFIFQGDWQRRPLGR